uniref:Uncharacterized protein n=1 Tax=Vespula pensylvanica TaxID=30213 RepID=A0A834U9Y0_VESPE|nr:hypothetical protein H0235_007593 [Vespula pensylvanica]
MNKKTLRRKRRSVCRCSNRFKRLTGGIKIDFHGHGKSHGARKKAECSFSHLIGRPPSFLLSFSTGSQSKSCTVIVANSSGGSDSNDDVGGAAVAAAAVSVAAAAAAAARRRRKR